MILREDLHWVDHTWTEQHMRLVAVQIQADCRDKVYQENKSEPRHIQLFHSA